MKMEIFEGADGKHYIRMKAGNGETLFVTEGYSTRWNAHRAATLIRDNAHLCDIIPHVAPDRDPA